MTKKLSDAENQENNTIFIPRTFENNNNSNTGDRQPYAGPPQPTDVLDGKHVINEHGGAGPMPDLTGHVPRHLAAHQAEQLLAYSSVDDNPTLRSHIEAALATGHVTTACENYLVALRYSLHHSVADALLQYIRDNFSRVSDSQGFLSLPLAIVTVFLRDSHLRVHTELDVYVAALMWLDYNKQERLTYGPDVLRCVRFTYFSPQDIIKYVEPNTQLFAGEQGKEALVSIYRTHMLILAGLRTHASEPPRNYLKPPEIPIRGSLYFRPDQDDMDKRIGDFHFDIKSHLRTGPDEQRYMNAAGGYDNTGYETDLYPTGNVTHSTYTELYDYQPPIYQQPLNPNEIANPERFEKEVMYKESNEDKPWQNKASSTLDSIRTNNNIDVTLKTFEYQQRSRMKSHPQPSTSEKTYAFNKYLEQQQKESAKMLADLPNAKESFKSSDTDNVFAKYLTFQGLNASQIFHSGSIERDKTQNKMYLEKGSKEEGYQNLSCESGQNISHNKDVSSDTPKKPLSERLKEYRFSLLKPLTSTKVPIHQTNQLTGGEHYKNKSNTKQKFNGESGESSIESTMSKFASHDHIKSIRNINSRTNNVDNQHIIQPPKPAGTHPIVLSSNSAFIPVLPRSSQSSVINSNIAMNHITSGQSVQPPSTTDVTQTQVHHKPRPFNPLVPPFVGKRPPGAPTPRRKSTFSQESKSALIIERLNVSEAQGNTAAGKNTISIRWKPLPKPALKENTNKRGSQERRNVSFAIDNRESSSFEIDATSDS